MSTITWPPTRETPGPMILDEVEARLERGELVRTHFIVHDLVSWAHRELIDDDEELRDFYARVTATIGYAELRHICADLVAHIGNIMELGAGEGDYGQMAHHLGILGAISCLGVVPDFPTQRRFDRVVDAFVKKRHQRGQLRAAIYSLREDDPLWSQPICQRVVMAT